MGNMWPYARLLVETTMVKRWKNILLLRKLNEWMNEWILIQFDLIKYINIRWLAIDFFASDAAASLLTHTHTEPKKNLSFFSFFFSTNQSINKLPLLSLNWWWWSIIIDANWMHIQITDRHTPNNQSINDASLTNRLESNHWMINKWCNQACKLASTHTLQSQLSLARRKKIERMTHFFWWMNKIWMNDQLIDWFWFKGPLWV